MIASRIPKKNQNSLVVTLLQKECIALTNPHVALYSQSDLYKCIHLFNMDQLLLMQSSGNPNMVLPIGPNDTLIDLGPNRVITGLPHIYQTPSHLKKVGPGRIFYYIQELSVPSLMVVMKLENKLCIPHGTETFAIEQGEHLWTQLN